MTRDPLGYVDGPNLHQYAVNSPLSYTDPMGLYVGTPEEIEAVIEQIGSEEFAISSRIQDRAAIGVIHGFLLTPVDIVQGGYQMARHPIRSAQGLWYVATHPFEVAAEGIVAFQHASVYERGRMIGGAVGGVLWGAGASKALSAGRSAYRAFEASLGDDLAEATGVGITAGAAEGVAGLRPWFSQWEIARLKVRRGTTASVHRFVDGDLFEKAIHSDAGTVRVLAETSVSGRTLTLSDLVVYADDGTLVNQVGARQFLTLRTQVAREAAEAGFDTLRITGVRVQTSSSANPGAVIDRVIDLSRFKK